MTAITKRKSQLTFVTEDSIRYRGRLRRVVVEVDRNGYSADLRLEGTQKRFPISFAGIYNQAVKIAVDKEVAAKRAAKKGRAR